MIKSKRVILSYFCGAAVLLGTTAASLAATSSTGDRAITKPVYNSATNSYFQLYKHGTRGASYNWRTANIQAQRHIYNGERGRLAIINDKNTLAFVREKFTIPKSTWIGGRFFCKFRKLIWVDGVVQSPSVAGMWHSQWYRQANVNCNHGLSQHHYMPVYLTGTGTGGVFWQAAGQAKKHYYYLVEYPAREKSKNAKKNSGDMTEPTGATQ